MAVIDTVTRRIRLTGNNPALVKEGRWTWWNFPRRTAVSSTVTDDGALSLTAFYRGISLISGTLASLPLHIYEEKDDDAKKGKIKTADTSYLWRRPNNEMTRQTFWERVIADEVRGNAFIYVSKDDLGRVSLSGDFWGMWYIERTRVKVGRASSGQKVYEIDNGLPMIDYKDGGEIVHIPNWGDALVGYDPISLANQALALGMSAEEYATRTFSQGQVPPGIITSDQILTETQADELLTRWRALHSGLEKQRDVAFLGGGAKFQQISQDLERLQMESLRRFQVQEVARLLGLPPHLLSDVDHASQGGGNGMEEQNRVLITFTFQAHISRFEQAIDDALLVRELTNRYSKFDLRGFLRGNTRERYEAYRAADFLTQNNKLALEDMEPVPDGDNLLSPLNLATSEDREAQQKKIKAESVGALIRAGFDPAESLSLVGLPPIKHTGRLPVTVQAEEEKLEE